MKSIATLDNDPYTQYLYNPALGKYINGNYSVTIYNNGTKIREYENKPIPDFPESVDLKITDYCDLGCPYCHEQSTKQGKHGDLSLTLEMWKDMPAGVEIAIGGGNPLEHPNLIDFLKECKQRGHICNLTVNQLHLAQFSDSLIEIVDNELIKGLGISIRAIKELKSDLEFLSHSAIDANIVAHVILGINSFDDLNYCPKKVLLLGYKQFGWGNRFYKIKNDFINQSIKDWKRKIPYLFNLYGRTISFDNLALEQLEIHRYFSPEQWNKFYMGSDGQFTMYVDVVKKEFAMGSTSVKRHPILNRGLRECFNVIKK